MVYLDNVTKGNCTECTREGVSLFDMNSNTKVCKECVEDMLETLTQAEEIDTNRSGRT